MNVELFIAKRILFGNSSNNSFTRPIINIAVWGIALGVLIMIMSVAVTSGFQKEIKGKIVGFASDIQITDSGLSESYESSPLHLDTNLYANLNAFNKIEHVQKFANKAGIIKTKEDIHGVILKGIAPDFNWTFFKKHLIEGDTLGLNNSTISKDAMISAKIANTLKLKLNDQFKVFFISKIIENGKEHFVQKKHSFYVKGIYETGLSEEFDAKFIFIDLKRIQKLNHWSDTIIGGYEIFLAKESFLKSIQNVNKTSYDYYLEKENELKDEFFLELSFLDVKSVYSRYQQIVNWLDYIDMHIFVILMIILLVAVVNMSSALLILILEKTNMIGILKSLGANNWSIRKVFLINCAYLIAKGTFLGNVLALLICGIQIYFKPLKLDAAIYYLDSVPIALNLWHWAGINLLTIGVCSIMLILPSVFISKISPVKAIRFN